MLDDSGRRADRRREPSYIRLNTEHQEWCRAVLLLESLGARRCWTEDGAVYQFPSWAAQDDALELVRRKFGSTVAEPYDVRPRTSGGRLSSGGSGAPAAGTPRGASGEAGKT